MSVRASSYDEAQPIFSPDATQIAMVSRDARVGIWDTQSGAPLHPLLPGLGQPIEHPRFLKSLAYSAKGDRLLLAHGDTVHIWDSHSGVELRRLSDPKIQRFFYAALDPDGSRVVTSDVSKPGGSIHLWNADAGNLLKQMNPPGYANMLSFSADGSIITAMSDVGEAGSVWNARSLKQMMTFKYDFEDKDFNPQSVAISRDGQYAATAHTYTVRLYQPQRAKSQDLDHDGNNDVVEFSPDGKRLLVGGMNHSVRIWDTSSGALVSTLEGHRDVISQGQFAANGELAIGRRQAHQLSVAKNCHRRNRRFPKPRNSLGILFPDEADELTLQRAMRPKH